VVDAGAAKATEANAINIASTREAFARNVAMKECTEGQNELCAERVIGFLLARYYRPKL